MIGSPVGRGGGHALAAGDQTPRRGGGHGHGGPPLPSEANLLTILNDKLPGDDGGTVVIADIDALIRERNIGPATIEWLRQLHASGECDYLAALRLRSSRQ